MGQAIQVLPIFAAEICMDAKLPRQVGAPYYVPNRPRLGVCGPSEDIRFSLGVEDAVASARPVNEWVRVYLGKRLTERCMQNLIFEGEPCLSNTRGHQG
jgi:hypothetical protein